MNEKRSGAFREIDSTRGMNFIDKSEMRIHVSVQLKGVSGVNWEICG
jgi:hypothetical protein